MARFHSGCVGVNEFLFKINQIDSPNCPHCVNTVESIKHFVCFCPKYANSRDTFSSSLVKLGIDIHCFSLAILFTGMGLPKTKYVKVMREFYKFIQKTGRDNL